MPEAVVTDDQEEVLPEDTLFKGALIKVVAKTKSWDDKYTGQRETAEKWVWHFKITDGEHAGKVAKGETFARVRTGSQPWEWITALAGQEPAKGQAINTDHYIGLTCMFEVTQRSFTGRNGQVTIAEVARVYPPNPGDSEPPF